VKLKQQSSSHTAILSYRVREDESVRRILGQDGCERKGSSRRLARKRRGMNRKGERARTVGWPALLTNTPSPPHQHAQPSSPTRPALLTHTPSPPHQHAQPSILTPTQLPRPAHPELSSPARMQRSSHPAKPSLPARKAVKLKQQSSSHQQYTPTPVE
jgi:hypothetical protein